MQKNDSLINRASKRFEGVAQARLVRWQDANLPVLFESNMFRVRLNRRVISPEIFSFFAPSTLYGKQVFARAQKANQTSINQHALSSILVPLFSCDEQQTIGNILRRCEAKIHALESEAELLSELFKTMLEELMKARLSVVPLIESETAHE